MIEELHARAIWKILVRYCSASPGLENQFVVHAAAGFEQYSFGGSLGPGATLQGSAAGWRVTYDPEDETEERKLMAYRVNAALRRCGGWLPGAGPRSGP